MKKRLTVFSLATLFSLSVSSLVFAGEWKSDSNGWWYQKDDGTWYANEWQWIDGNQDGIAESYYFYDTGYMAANTVIESYTVNADGAWTVDGVVQTQVIGVQAPQTQTAFEFNSQSAKNLQKYLDGAIPPGKPNWDESNAERKKPTSTVYQYTQYWSYLMDISDEELTKMMEAAKSAEKNVFYKDLEWESTCRAEERERRNWTGIFDSDYKKARYSSFKAPEDRLKGLLG